MRYLVAFLGGVLTIASPCILPVLPFVFTGAGRSFKREGLPLLAGMALMFTVVASLATLAGDWVVRANQAGRAVALVVFAVLGAALLVPSVADWLTRPLVRIGAMGQRANGTASFGGHLLLGASTGLLWAPCAGPILGLILATSALQGPSAGGALLVGSFAVGASCALAFVLLAGGRVVRALRGIGHVENVLRRGLGAAVLCGVAAIAMGWDTGLLARLSLSTFGTATALEQRLVERVQPAEEAPAMAMDAAPMMMMGGAARGAQPGPAEMPSLDGATSWLNSAAIRADALRGKVVLIDFWTYSCINCLRAIPYVQAWQRKYADDGLVVIGVHTPEFAFERDAANVARATRELGLTYPVAIDSDRAIWTAFSNRFWPAHYLIDRQGKVQYRHFGEGRYDETERTIRALLRGGEGDEADVVEVAATGVQAPPNLDDIQSPETYVGYERQENYASAEAIVKDRATRYTSPRAPALNQWGLDGEWTVGTEHATLAKAGGRVVFRFHARDLHLVLAPGPDGRPVRFTVAIDGRAPGGAHGVDVDAGGRGRVTESRLYQLIRQDGAIEDRTFTIEFLDPGVQVFAFTFG